MDENSDKPDEAQNNHHHDEDSNQLLSELRRKQSRADEGREPHFLSGRLGTRMMSQAALIERIVAAFEDEHGTDSVSIQEAETETQKLKLVRETTDYVLAVESVDLSLEEKAMLIRRVFAELFTYGPLDALLRDQEITTVLLEGADKVSVRRGHGELEKLNPIFDDEGHLKRVLQRILRDAGTEMKPEQSIIEAGITAHGRRIAVNLALPPVTFQINVDLRLHPVDKVSLKDFVQLNVMTDDAAKVIEAIARSEHGFLIVGDTESGKTTLMSIMAALRPADELISVERAGELKLPEGVQSFVVQWGSADRPEISFGDQILAALEQNPQTLILDEVRADEPHSIKPLLHLNTSMRQAWVFRGTADSKRLLSALGMVARRSDPERGEEAVNALYRNLPFIITLRRSQGKIQLRSILEWQFQPDSYYPDLVELMTRNWEGLVFTGQCPSHPLDLPDSLWES